MSELEALVVEDDSAEYWERRALYAESKLGRVEKERDSANRRHGHADNRLRQLRGELAELRGTVPCPRCSGSGRTIVDGVGGSR